MKKGYLATSVALFCIAGIAFAQPPFLGGSYPLPPPYPPKPPRPVVLPRPADTPRPLRLPRPAEPPRLQDIVQLGRPVALREVSKPAAPLTVCSHLQPVAATDGHARVAPPCGCDECPTLCYPVCGPGGRVWASAEYLLWWFEGSHVPPLVTTSPAASSGVLGAPGTTILLGSSSLEEDAHSGGRFTLGYWLNRCQTIGLEGEFLFLGSRATEFTAGGSGLPGSQLIARPVVNGLAAGETAELVNFPGAVAGNIHVSSSSRLEGGELNGLANLCCACCYRVDLIGGFRYLALREGIGITEDLAVRPTVPIIGGSTFAVADQFSTRNQFYGGQLGARGEYRRGKVFLDMTGSLALGSIHEEIDIHGSTLITSAGGARTTLAGGILALPTNSGHFTRDQFAVVPEIGIHVGYQVTRYLRAFVGYSFLYASNLVRPGDVIDRTVNLTQIPSTLGPGTLIGPARPAVVLKDTDFWAQGINFGLDVRY